MGECKANKLASYGSKNFYFLKKTLCLIPIFIQKYTEQSCNTYVSRLQTKNKTPNIPTYAQPPEQPDFPILLLSGLLHALFHQFKGGTDHEAIR